jgi:hypothetical protein
MDCDAKIGSDLGEALTDVPLGAEPQLAAVRQPGGKCFSYE